MYKICNHNGSKYILGISLSISLKLIMKIKHKTKSFLEVLREKKEKELTDADNSVVAAWGEEVEKGIVEIMVRGGEKDSLKSTVLSLILE